jgi:hypothetical protein
MGCAVEDIIHHFLHGRIKLGVRVRDELLSGMNADLHTIGAYHVSGVRTIPTSCAEAGWEFDPQGPARAGSLLIEPDYPLDITEASYSAEDSVPPAFWGWAPGRDWDNPEMDHSRIERFGVGFTGIDENGNPVFDWRPIDPARLVIHAVERKRFDGQIRENAVATSAKATALTKEKTTLLVLVAALCMHAKLDPQARGASQRIREMTEDLGAGVDDETIRTLLKQIPDAMERRGPVAEIGKS